MLLGHLRAVILPALRRGFPMPRKQRFKPSRKPKPVPPNDDAMMGRPVSNPAGNPERTPEREIPQVADNARIDEREPESQSG
jgi:hypothetical protein